MANGLDGNHGAVLDKIANKRGAMWEEEPVAGEAAEAAEGEGMEM